LRTVLDLKAHWFRRWQEYDGMASGQSMASACTVGAGEGSVERRHNPLTSQRVASTVICSHKRGRRDSNPQPPDRQLGGRIALILLSKNNLRREGPTPTQSIASTFYAGFPWFLGILWQIVWHSLAPRRLSRVGTKPGPDFVPNIRHAIENPSRGACLVVHRCGDGATT
jgi:hypothetical protein